MSIIGAKLSKRSDIFNWGQIVQNWHIIVRIKYNDYIYYLFLVISGVLEGIFAQICGKEWEKRNLLEHQKLACAQEAPRLLIYIYVYGGQIEIIILAKIIFILIIIMINSLHGSLKSCSCETNLCWYCSKRHLQMKSPSSQWRWRRTMMIWRWWIDE